MQRPSIYLAQIRTWRNKHQGIKTKQNKTKEPLQLGFLQPKAGQPGKTFHYHKGSLFLRPEGKVKKDEES